MGKGRRAQISLGLFLGVSTLVDTAHARPTAVDHNLTVRMTYRLVRATVSQTAIYGHTIVWTQTVPPRHGNLVPERLFASRVAHIVKHLVFSFPQGTTVVRLAISRDWITAALSGSTGSSLWAFNRVSRTAHTVGSWAVTSGSTLAGFALSEDQVVYTVDQIGKDPRNGTFTVHVATLPDAGSIVLTRFLRCGQIAEAGMVGGSILATISHGCESSDAVGIDPTTGAVTALTASHRAIDAFTNGSAEGWLKTRPAAGALAPTGIVILHQAGTGNNVPVSRAVKSEPPTCARNGFDACAGSPGATDALAYWVDGSGQPVAYDLTNGSELHIHTSQPPSIAGMGQGFGRMLTWPSSVSQPVPGEPQSWIVVARVS